MLNGSFLNKAAVNATGFVAGAMFLAASAVAEATVISSADRLAKTTSHAEVEARGTGQSRRYAALFGEAIGQANLFSDSVRFAYSLSYGGEGNVFSSDSAVRLAKLTSDLAANGVISVAAPDRARPVFPQDAIISAMTDGTAVRLARPLIVDPQVSGFTYIKDSLTKKHRITPVYLEAELTGRVTARGTANSWMGFAASGISGYSVGDITPIRRAGSHAQGEVVTHSVPTRITHAFKTAIIAADALGELTYTTAEGDTFHLATASAGLATVAEDIGSVRYGNSFAGGSVVLHADSRSRKHKAAYSKSAVYELSATGSAVRLGMLGSLTSVLGETVGDATRHKAKWFASNSSWEAVFGGQPYAVRPAQGDAAGSLQTDLSATMHWKLRGQAEGEAGAWDDSILITPAYGALMEGAFLAEGYAIRWVLPTSYAATGELTMVGYGRAGIHQQAPSSRSHFENGDKRVVLVSFDNRTLEV